MKMTSVSKVQFTNLNDKRYYFSDGIVSLLSGHPLLSDLSELKKLSKCYRKRKRQIIKNGKSSC